MASILNVNQNDLMKKYDNKGNYILLLYYIPIIEQPKLGKQNESVFLECLKR